MSIADLERALAERMRGYGDAGADSLAETMTAVINPGGLRAMLAEFISSNARLEQLASRSVWHPNGFGKIVLLSHPSYKLRLHIWRSGEAPSEYAQENIHNHRWDFAMILLSGRYRHQEFRLTDDGEKFHAYTYNSTAGKGSYTLTPAGPRTLRCVFDAHLCAGSRYTISSEVFHRVVPDISCPAVSLVLEGPPKPSAVDVFAAEAVGESAAAPLHKLSAQYLIASMKAVMSLPEFD